MSAIHKENIMKRIVIAILLCHFIAATAPVAFARNDEILRVGVANHQDYLDPGKDHSNVGSQYYINAFNTLVGKNPFKSEIEFQPQLAVSWKMITPRLIELTIRQGVKFHNGDPMTIDDVVFSLQRMFDPAFAPYITRHNEYFENMYRVDKVDARTLRVYSKRPEPLMKLLLNTQQSMIVPRAYIMGLTGHPEVDEPSDYEAFGKAPVGTGPYKITKFIPGEETVYERFDEYWGEKAPFKRVVYKKIPELSARITALVNGEVDIITNVPPDQLTVLDRNPDLKAEGMVTPLFHVVFYNTAHPKMTRPLRRALSLAIDRKLLNEALWMGKCVVPNTHTYPQYGPYYTPDILTFEYDPEKAKALIKENGLEGTKVRFDTAPVYYTNGLLAAQAIGEMWAEIGIIQELNVVERWTGGDPDMEARNWSNPMYFADPAGSFGTMWSPTGARVTAGTWTPKPEYEEMWNRFRYETDVKKRNAAYKEVMDYIREEAPFIVLYQPFESYGMRKHIQWKPLPGHIPYVLDFTAGKISVVK